MAAGGQRLALVLPLAARTGALGRFATAVSTPGTAEYGHFRSIAWLAHHFGASTSVRSRVIRYLRRAGASQIRIDATGLFADASLPAGTAGNLFGTTLRRFHGTRSGEYMAPSHAARIPPALRGAVTAVIGLDTRPLTNPADPQASGARANARRAHSASTPTSALPHTGASGGCAAGQGAGEVGGDPTTDGFTPNQYLTAYGFSGLQSAGLTGQGERVALIEIDGYNAGDLSTFASCFGLTLPPVHAFTVGVHHPLRAGGESTLDIEVLDAAAPGLSGIDVYEANSNAAETLRALTAPLQHHGFHPAVISASLGLCEPAVAGAIGIRGLRSTEAALSMAAANGITVLASSGDSGSADCTGSDGVPLPRLAVNYPASSPWVTAVGGTNLDLSSTNTILGQVVWNDGSVEPGAAAGGGSSALFMRPYYQKGTVSQNRRALPDVSMLADVIPGYAFYCTASGDCVNSHDPNPWQSVGGTSAATPLLAGGLAIVDEALSQHRQQPLGLVNPLLYTLGRSSDGQQVYSDVTRFGNDVGPFITDTSQDLGCCTARAGFDRASGWGSLNLSAFASAALARTPPIIGLALPHGQRPVRARHIVATVSCQGACRIGAYANVSVGARNRPFQADSRVTRLASAGSVTLQIAFSKRELGRLRSALAHHRTIHATVYGVTVLGRRTIQSQTPGQRIQISG